MICDMAGEWLTDGLRDDKIGDTCCQPTEEFTLRRNILIQSKTMPAAW